ncbi:hypothetical protein B9Z55_015928 [Caenorhabditis nigoni]|uniref:F-box domain-containing protein n=2 Tax=Caenorhabditis nigoni TaxID=1611254 RepID=A0A2G5UCE4_9PELO|nr:hypothetical protein B9Z55_015928 [Caenorhabditis nigoni]
MPFPILRTPFVVLSEIISLLEPNEIVTASFCSKNIRCLLKRHYQRGKPLEWRLLMINHDSWGRVSIETSKNGEQITVMSAKHISELQGHELKQNNEKCPVIYFEDLRLGTAMIVDYVTGLFRLDVFAVVMDSNGIWAIDWVNNRQEKMLGGVQLIKSLKYNSNADETLDYVLRNARFSLYFNLDYNVSDNFKFDGKLGPMKQLWIRSNGHWVTCDNLMNFDGLAIRIQGSKLSISDFNAFLRHWRAGASARLEYLYVSFEQETFIERFDDDLEVVETDEEKVFRRSFDGHETVFTGGYSIQRTDGVEAMIQCSPRWFLMGVWH